jgi:hypothetical protein
MISNRKFSWAFLEILKQCIRRQYPRQGIDPLALAEALAGDNQARFGDGFTICPVKRSRLNVDSGTDYDSYIASVHGYEWRFGRYPTTEEFLAWIVMAFSELSVSGSYVGGWWHEGKFILDVSRLINGKDAAHKFALNNRQNYIYHPATKTEIRVL